MSDSRFFGYIALASFSIAEGFATLITSRMEPGPTTSDWIFSAFLVGPLLFFMVGLMVGVICCLVAMVKFPR